MAIVSALERHPIVDQSLVDRWIYVLMAGLFVVVAVVGFAPNSAGILAGERPSPPLVIHIHAALMVSWLTLLLTQTLLMATGRSTLHKTLGLASLALAPAVLAGMVAATLSSYDGRLELAATVGMGEEIAAAMAANILLAQGRSIVYFALFFLWAILVRERDPETHKRMMLLAALVPLPAAIGRMVWLPTTLPASYDSLHAYMLLLLAPAVAYDIVRRGHPHQAYLIGVGLLLPWIVGTHFLWSSPSWIATVQKIMGG